MPETSIEELVRARKLKAARKAILEYAREHESSEDSLIRACDWLRRLGLSFEGFKLLKIESALKESGPTRGKLGRRAIWAARFFNEVGASRYALELIRRVRPETAAEHRIAGWIQLANFEYAEARKSFEEASRREKGDPYEHRIALVGLADAMSGLGEFDRAVKIADDVRTRSTEPLLQGICLQAIGEYHVRAGRMKEAESSFEAARPLFPVDKSSTDVSTDMALLAKWQGYARLKRFGTEDQVGRELMDRAWKTFKAPGRREEGWLDVLRLQNDAGLLKRVEQDRLIAFPGIPEPMLATTLNNLRAQTRYPLRFGSARAPLRIYLGSRHGAEASGEFVFKERWHTVVPLEIKLVAMLRVAGTWSLSRVRAKVLLWPTELHSYSQQDARLDQLISRVRKVYGLEIKTSHGQMTLSSMSQVFVEIEKGQEATPQFLKTLGKPDADFRGEELEAFYGISRPQRFLLLKRWLDSGWIERVGRSPSTAFRRKIIQTV